MSNSNKKIHLDDLLNKSRKVYEQFDKSKGSSRLDFGSIYLTRPSEKGISNIVTIIDILKDDDQSNNKYVNVAPISLDIEMAADDDLILEGIENNGPLPCDITIHAGMQMTISIDDISSYYTHLSKKHQEKLKKLLLLLEGDYSIDIETLSIGSPIISPKDYRVEYRNNLVRDLEYLTIPAFISVSNYINQQKPEQFYEHDYKRAEEKIIEHYKYKQNFSLYLDYISDNLLPRHHFDDKDKTYYETLIEGFNVVYLDQTNKGKKLIKASLGEMKKLDRLKKSTSREKKQLKAYREILQSRNKESENKSLYEIIKRYNKKGIKTIIPGRPNEPDLIIEDENGHREPIEIKIEKRAQLIPSIAVHKIKEFNFQRRVDKDHESYKVLRESIKRDGILNPILLTNDYGCIDGGRRLAIAKELKMKTVSGIMDREGLFFISEWFSHDYKNQIRKVRHAIQHGKNDKLFEIINKWESKRLPFSNFKNPYGGTIKWMPWYANGNIEGLKKVNQELKGLVDENLNHIGVDTAITITNGRILQLEGKPEQAIEQYQQLNTEEFMKNSIFTNPLIDCYSKLGDGATASAIANKDIKLVEKRAEWAFKSTSDKQLWKDENISAVAAA